MKYKFLKIKAHRLVYSLLLAGALFALSFAVTSSDVRAAPPPGFQSTPVITTGLEAPTGFEIAPDGRIFILERAGRVRIYKNGQLLSAPFVTMSAVASGDRGLIGIDFDPDFTTNCYVYFYYTNADDLLNYVVRYNGCSDVGTDRQIIYNTTSPSNQLHVGGSVQFGTDGKLYLAVGDNGYPPNAQDLSNPHGKILRINKDGSIPTDNPFYNQAGRLGEIWAYGMRNPWRFQFDSVTGNLYGGDVGNYSWEEINHIVRGGNYGWPIKEGYCTPSCEDTINPLYAYPHAGASASVTGGPIYRGSMFPADYQGDLIFADLAQGVIKRIEFDAEGNRAGVKDFDSNVPWIADMKVAPDGSMYYVAFFPGRLYRVTYDTANPTPSASASADVTKGQEPLTVHFSSAGSNDPNGDPLTYSWDFDDGTTSTEANPTKTFADKGTYTVELTVSDGTNQAQAVPVVIQVGEPPTVTISSPTEGAKYKAGDTITYNAFAADAAGLDIDDGNISTEVILHHDTHTHPFVEDMIGRVGSFTVPNTGEAAANTWYEIITTATDENGLVATDTVNIHPQVVTLRFETNQPGIGVNIDGVPYANNYEAQAVVGFKRELSAAPIRKGLNGKVYQFQGWSDGGQIKHTITTPNANTTYTAMYGPAPAWWSDYFNNRDLTGPPAHTRGEPEINNNWGTAVPAPGVSADNFSARYGTWQYFAAGTYKFTSLADDGVRLYIDDKLVIDAWYPKDDGRSVVLDMTEGTHKVVMEYFELSGSAHNRLTWDLTNESPDISPSGYTATYYSNATLSGDPSYGHIDNAIDFNWGAGSPHAYLPVNNFSARWVKSDHFPAGDYTFTVTADDGVRLYVDDRLVLDKWTNVAPPTTYTVATSLATGRHTIKMEYFEASGNAQAKMSYARTGNMSGYEASYWNIPSTGTAAIPAAAPHLRRVDNAVDFDWRTGSPGSPIATDNFAARWVKTVPQGGTYKIVTTSDDGIRIWANNQLVIDQWSDHAPVSQSALVTVPDNWEIKIEYYDRGAGAVAKVDYTTNIAGAYDSGYSASYWNLPSGAAIPPVIPLTAPTLARKESAIANNWGSGSPHASVTTDRFVARWNKTVELQAGTYRFTSRSDDGIKVFVDGWPFITRWNNHAPTNDSADVTLAAGYHYIVVEYYENNSGATAEFNYQKL